MYAADQARVEEPPEASELAMQRVLLWYLHTSDMATIKLVPEARHFELVTLDMPVSASTFDTYEEANSWYENEKMNLVAAVRAAADMAIHEIAWQLSVALYPIYALRNQFDDWVTTSLIALGSARQLGNRRGEAEALESLGKAHAQAANLQLGVQYQEAALAIRRELRDHFGEVTSTNAIGLVRLRGRELNDALSYLRRANTIAGEIGDDYWIGVSLNNIANVHLELEQFHEAEQLLRQALVIYRRLDIPEGDVLRGLSRAYRGLGEPEEASSLIQQALRIARLKENHAWEAFWLVEYGRVLLDLDQTPNALTSFQRAAQLQRRLGDRLREADALDATGETYQRMGRHQEAADFHRMSVATFGELGDNWRHAVALDHLATAVYATDGLVEAEPHWRKALTIFETYSDPLSMRIRSRINELMDGSTAE